jgi:hypothetical protein
LIPLLPHPPLPHFCLPPVPWPVCLWINLVDLIISRKSPCLCAASVLSSSLGSGTSTTFCASRPPNAH